MEGQRSEVEQLEQGHLASGKHKNIAHDVSINIKTLLMVSQLKITWQKYC